MGKITMTTYKTIHAYVDGAFNQWKPNLYAGAYVLVDPEENQIIEADSGCGSAAARMRNVAGELSATMRATKAGIKVADKIVIHYDYTGIEKWVTGKWNCYKDETKAYRKFMLRYKEHGKIEGFVKVKAHSGNKFNETADFMAKKALREKIQWKES